MLLSCLISTIKLGSNAKTRYFFNVPGGSLVVENYTENQIERDFKGVWIPKEIWLDENLSWTEKILLVEIDSLAQNNECFATNEHFAQFLHLKKDTISKAISSLKNKGYVEVTLQYKDGTKEIIRRVIDTTGYRKKILGGLGKKSETPPGKKSYYNNTNNNNTNNNTERECAREALTHPPKKRKEKNTHGGKQKYGKFENIFLSDVEIENLKQEYPSNYSEVIDKLSAYMAAKKENYENHYAAVVLWLLREKKNKTQNTQNSYNLDAYETETDFLGNWNAKYQQDEESLDYLKGL